jgi:hypothetical protein
MIFNFLLLLFYSRQIAQFCELFPTDSLAEYVQPITFILALDKVAQVRTTAVKAVSVFESFKCNSLKKM